MAPDQMTRFLSGYAPIEGVADELKRPDGSMRPVWTPLMRHLAGQSAETLARSGGDVASLVADLRGRGVVRSTDELSACIQR